MSENNNDCQTPAVQSSINLVLGWHVVLYMNTL